MKRIRLFASLPPLILALTFALGGTAWAKGGTGDGTGHGGGTAGGEVQKIIAQEILTPAGKIEAFKSALIQNYESVFKIKAATLPIKDYKHLRDERDFPIPIQGVPAVNGETAHIEIRVALWKKLDHQEKLRRTLEAVLVATGEEPQGAGQLTFYLFSLILDPSPQIYAMSRDAFNEKFKSTSLDQTTDWLTHITQTTIASILLNADNSPTFQKEISQGYRSFKNKALRVPIFTLPEVFLEEIVDGKKLRRPVMMRNFSDNHPRIELSREELEIYAFYADYCLTNPTMAEVYSPMVSVADFEQTVLHEVLGATDEELSEVFVKSTYLYNLPEILNIDNKFK